MKKIVIVFIFSFIWNISYVKASNYIVYDMDSSRVLMGENIHSPRLIASISKILTCIIAIENGNLNDTLTIDKNVLKTTGSSLYLSIGEKISLKDLLYGMMLRSGNDAATAVAFYISDSMENFAVLMNEYAKKIGMNDSTFYNSTGLEESTGIGNISSVYDMAILTNYAMNNEVFRQIFKTKEYVSQTNYKKYHWQNKNKLLKYDYITGGKTGYTLKAKRTLVTTGLINDENIVIVTLNDSNDWNTHTSLYKSLKDNYKKTLLLDKNNLEFNFNGMFLDSYLYIKNNFYYGLFSDDDIKINYYLNNNSNNKNIVGTVEIKLNNETIYTDNIYIKNKKENKLITFFKKIFSYKN